MDGSVGDDDLRVLEAGGDDPFTHSGNRWLGDICAEDMTARADMLRQLKNCRAGTATNIEYALARVGRRQIQQLLRESSARTVGRRHRISRRSLYT